MKICPKCGYSMMFYYLNYDINKRVYECTHCKHQEIVYTNTENTNGKSKSIY